MPVLTKRTFERETKNNARAFAIHTASAFLVRQLQSSRIVSYLDKLSIERAHGEAQLPLRQREPLEDVTAGILIRHGEDIDNKLRDLAPGYSLLSKGYRLPVPRIRVLDTRSGIPDATRSKPIEVRDALRDARVITLHVPREYPDLSLSWIVASDLLSAQLDESQVVPSVIESRSLQRPRFGIARTR